MADGARLAVFDSVKPGDRVEIYGRPRPGKHVVEMVIPRASLLESLPQWYVPQKFRVPNSLVVLASDGIRAHVNVPFEHVISVTRSNRCTISSSGRDLMHVGMHAVLYAPLWPIGIVRNVYEKTYEIECADRTYVLWYEKPLFRVFETAERASRWRQQRIQFIEQALPLVRPGDLVLRAFCNSLESRTSQSEFTLVKRVGMERIARPGINMEAINKFLIDNFIDEDIGEDEMDMSQTVQVFLQNTRGSHTSLQQILTGRRFYLTSPAGSYVRAEFVQDVYLTADADCVTIGNFPHPIYVGDRVEVKVGKSAAKRVPVDRIVYGGIVLAGIYHPLDKLDVKGKIAPPPNDDNAIGDDVNAREATNLEKCFVTRAERRVIGLKKSVRSCKESVSPVSEIFDSDTSSSSANSSPSSSDDDRCIRDWIKKRKSR
jgi:hypothetical protein